jgi:single-stranded-DNA-specific exonuclease
VWAESASFARTDQAPGPRRTSYVDSLVRGAAWLARHGDGAAVVPHHDADGLSAGVLLARRSGGPMLHVESPWDRPLAVEGAAIVADWGVRPVAGPSEVLYVDHHAGPESVCGTVVLPPAGRETSTSLVAWKLLGRPATGAWLAALGAVGDLGLESLKRREVPSVGSARALRKLAALATAPGRLRDGPVSVAANILAGARDESEAIRDPRTRELEAALAAVNQARRGALRTPPRVGPDAALIRFSAPARVHPLVAAAWSRRLAPRVVIAANDGWREGKVSFAVRCAADRDLRAWLLARWTPPRGSGDYARGHRRATGGSLAPEEFKLFSTAVLPSGAT